MSGELLVGGQPTTGTPLVIDEERQRRLDLFAAAALTGLLGMYDEKEFTGSDDKSIATWAWGLARAMLDNEPKDD